MKRAAAEVEAIEDGVAGEHQADKDEPDGRERHVSGLPFRWPV